MTYPILSIPDGKEQLRAFLKGVNDQAEAAMLGCTALDEVVRKIDGEPRLYIIDTTNSAIGSQADSAPSYHAEKTRFHFSEDLSTVNS